jgi:replicative DNA helicase
MQLKQVIDDIAGNIRTRAKETEYPVGIVRFDEMAWFTRKTLNVIAGRTSNMKTTFAFNNVAVNVAMSGKRVAYHSWEDSEQIIGDRFLASRLNIINKDIQQNNLTEEKYESICTFVDNMDNNLNLDIVMEAEHTFEGIRGYTEAQKVKTGNYPDMIIIDYINLLNYMGEGMGRISKFEAISELCRQLDLYSKEINACIIICCQVNRGAMGEGNSQTIHQPQNHHIKDCGDIEQVANIIVLLHYAYKYSNDDKDKYDIEVIVSKNKQGDTGKIKCRVTPEFNKIQ